MGTDAERSDLGKRLKDAREYAGFSQEDVAKHLGVSRSAISLIESGGRRLDIMELRKLSRLYDVSIDDLTGVSSKSESGSDSIRMVARAAADLTAQDRAEVLRFAEFLRSRQRRESDQ